MAALNSRFHNAIAHLSCSIYCMDVLFSICGVASYTVCHSRDMTPEIKVIGSNMCEGEWEEKSRRARARVGIEERERKKGRDAVKTEIGDKCYKKGWEPP